MHVEKKYYKTIQMIIIIKTSTHLKLQINYLIIRRFFIKCKSIIIT